MSSVDDIFKEMQEADKRARAKKASAATSVTSGMAWMCVKDEAKPKYTVVKTIDRTSAALLEPSNAADMMAINEQVNSKNDLAVVEKASAKLSPNCAREINILQGDNNRDRKKVLETMYSAITEILGDDLGKQLDDENVSSDFEMLMNSLDDLLKPLLLRLEDPIERCRELAIKTLTALLSQAGRGAAVDSFLPYIIPVVMERIGQDPIKEKSEEIRLELMTLITTVIESYGDRLAGHVDFLSTIVLLNSQDSNPEVRKKLCSMCLALTRAVPGVLRVPIDQEKNNRAIAITHYLAPSLSHKHASVRLATLEAVESLVMLAAGAAIEHLIGWKDPNVIPIRAFYGEAPEQINYFGMLASDNNAVVRERFYQMLARWLMHHEQRWDYERRMVPFMLTAVADETPKIAEFGFETFEKLGRIQEEEKEEDYVEQYRYNDDAWGATEEAVKYVTSRLPHPFKTRPRIGARVLVRGNVKKFIGALATELGDWKSKPKMASVRMLRVVFVYCEEYITSQLDTFLPALCKVCTDPDTGKEILESLVTLGAYVPVHAWLPLLTPHALGEFIDDTTYQMQVLQVVSAMVRGTHPTRLYKHVPELLDLLAAPELIDSQSTDLKLALADALYNLVDTRGFDAKRETPRLVWIHLLSHSSISPGNAGYDEIVAKAEKGIQLIDSIWKKHGGNNAVCDHFVQLLDHVSRDFKNWSSFSRELQVFEFLIGACSSELGKHLESVLAISMSLLCSEKERSVRIRAMKIIRHIIENVPKNLWGHETKLYTDLLTSVFNNFKQTPSTAMLNASLSTVVALLDICDVPANDDIEAGIDGMVSCVEVAREDTRAKSVDALRRVLISFADKLSSETLQGGIDAIMAGLNDSVDDVRVASAKALGDLSSKLSALDEEHIRKTLSTCILLLSSSFEVFQEELQHTLADMATHYPKLFVQEGEQRLEQLEAGRCMSLLEKARASMG